MLESNITSFEAQSPAAALTAVPDVPYCWVINVSPLAPLNELLLFVSAHNCRLQNARRRLIVADGRREPVDRIGPNGDAGHVKTLGFETGETEEPIAAGGDANGPCLTEIGWCRSGTVISAVPEHKVHPAGNVLVVPLAIAGFLLGLRGEMGLPPPASGCRRLAPEYTCGATVWWPID